MSNVESRFAALLGRPPSDAELIRFSRIQNALGLHENDALWSVIIALQLLSDEKGEPSQPRSVSNWLLVAVFLSAILGAFCAGRLTVKSSPPVGEITAAFKTVLAEQDKGKPVTIRIGNRVFEATQSGELPPADAPQKAEPPKIEN